MAKPKTILQVCVLILLLSACQETLQPSATGPLPTANGRNGSGCLSPQFPFAYVVDGPTPNDPFHPVAPPDSWELEIELPEFTDSALDYKSWVLAAFPTANGQYDLWVLRSWADDIASSRYEFMEILRYSTKAKEWKTVSPQVWGTQAFVGELFITADGSIWAHNYSGSYISMFEPPLRVGILNKPQDNVPPNIPLLSKYNEEETRFEPDNGVVSIPTGKVDKEWNKVLLDRQGLFWIVVQNDGIYSYDPKSQSTTRHANLPADSSKIVVKSVALASNGDIFLSDDSSSIYRFIPETNEIEQIAGTPLPFEDPYGVYFHNIVIDRTNRLWLGDAGWVEPEDYLTWYQLIRSPVFITSRGGGDTIYHWERPWLIRESVDGRLWYKSENGMTWLDPEKGEWCWFTTEQSNIVEDQQHNLWMVADNKLYKLDLEP